MSLQAVIFRQQLFKLSEAFITEQAQGLARYAPIYLGRERHGPAPVGTQSHTLADSPAWGQTRKAVQLLTADPAGYARLLDGARPALIHAHFGVDALYAAPLAARLRVPLVTTFHGFDATMTARSLLLSRFVSLSRYAMLRRGLGRAGSVFLCVSEAIRRKVLDLGFPEDKVRLHYIGVNLRNIQPRTERPVAQTVLHVGRLVEKKGTSYLLRAFADVARKMPEARLKIIGDGPLREGLVQLAGDLGISGQVEFAGPLPRAQVLEAMRSAAIIVVPSVQASSGDSEGLPTVLLEAAASGLPGVGTIHSGIPEAVVDGRTGHLVAERDVGALADRMTHMLMHPQVTWDMGLQARALVEDRFNLHRQTAALECIYDEVA